MPVTLLVDKPKEQYESTKKSHAEKQFYDAHTKDAVVKDAAAWLLTMDAWPCCDGIGSCHYLLMVLSMKRDIRLVVSEDHGGYAVNHGLKAGAKGTIIYVRGKPTYEPENASPPEMPEVTVAQSKATTKKAKSKSSTSSSSSSSSSSSPQRK